MIIISFITSLFFKSNLETQFDIAGKNKSEIKKALKRVPKEQYKGMLFIIKNMPNEDLKSLSSDFLLKNSNNAYHSWKNSLWQDQISEELYINYILPYANLNEKREDWFEILNQESALIIKNTNSISEAVVLLNKNIFKKLNVVYSTERPKADQSPSESIKAGMATCTGLSILLINACRSVGIPARFVGTPMWYNNSGNHSWVEIWDNGWHYVGAAEQVEDKLNDVWFLEYASQAIPGDIQYGIFAAVWPKTGTHFPMNWLPEVKKYNSIDVTGNYKIEKVVADLIPVRVRAIGQGGKRYSIDILVKDQDEIILQGLSKNEENDSNDHLTFMLEKGKTFSFETSFDKKSLLIEEELLIDFIVK